MATTRKLTTSTTGGFVSKPIARLAVQRIDALIGSIIQLDGRSSSDPDGKPLSWSWRYVQVPLGSTVEDSGFRSVRPKARAVSFIPDKIGVYVVGLIVNNGDLDSDLVTATVSIQISRVPCGENIVPDARFMWDYISNFWSLVEDREVITSIWSSVIQLIGAELITLWGTDNNKSLDTIQNTFQRRWEAFHPTTSLIDELDHRVIAGRTDSGPEAYSGNVGEEPTTLPTAVVYTNLGKPREIIRSDFTNLRGNYGPKGRVIVVNGETYTISRVDNKSVILGSGTDCDTSVGTDALTTGTTDLDVIGAIVGDHIILSTGPDIGTYRLLTVAGNAATVENLDGTAVLFSGDIGVSFSVERPFTLAVTDQDVIPNGQAKVSWRIPHLLHIPSVDLEAAGTRKGDVLVFEVTRRDTGQSTELRAQIMGADRHRAGFEFTLGTLVDGDENIDIELFKTLALDLRLLPPDSIDLEVEAVAKALVQFIPVGINLHTQPFTKYRLSFKAKTIIHNSVIVADPEIMSVPALQEQLKDPPVVLRENLDYVVEDGQLQFINNLFTPEDPIPETLWAECTFYDNGQVIENNFGRMVSLLREDLSTRVTRVPYLSAVKGLFFAFTTGPTVDNLRLGLQILLGLPFTEEKGVILEINEDFATSPAGTSLGRILMEDLDEKGGRTGFRRIYFYPMPVGIEDNRTTGQPYIVGDTLDRFTPLSKGTEVQDYIKDPEWWTGTLVGLEVLKFFVFQVTVSSEVFETGEVTFALDFIKLIKPAYTKVITTALLELSDDIDIVDSLSGSSIELNFYDAPWGLESAKKADDDNHQGVILHRSGSAPLMTRTLRLLTDVRTTRDLPRPSATKIVVTSVTGWDSSLLRARDDTAFPRVEGDLLVILQNQPGAPSTAPGLYEITNVIDDNSLEIDNEAPVNDPTTFVPVPIDANLFEIGVNLTCSIVRREMNPTVRLSDLVVTVASNTVSSATGLFVSNGVRIGDHIIQEDGSDDGEYLIDASVIPAPANYPREVPRITETTLALKNLDGSTPSFIGGTGVAYRIIRPEMVPKVVPRVRSFYNSTLGQMELEVLDPHVPVGTGDETFDIFTPAMEGLYVEVTGSQNPVNDGKFLITEYVSTGRVVTDSPSLISDTDATSTIYL